MCYINKITFPLPFSLSFFAQSSSCVLQPTDEGLYSCHLHHHYCGLHERRQFHLRVQPPEIQPTNSVQALPSEDKGKKLNRIIAKDSFALPKAYGPSSWVQK